jgi:phosphoribosyl-AMP cyclohydrolase / phosphoribosyl-ATP pyrophosphohydrolase
MSLDFKKYADGLIPAIIQDANTNKVLMLGFMNEEALNKTKETKQVTFFSRSKKRLWTKGEESGNFLNVIEILNDCDDDTLLIKADPQGPVCHKGTDTCFKEINKSDNFLFELESIIQNRIKNPVEGSYTNLLLKKGMNKIAQKVGEEAVELVIEAKDENKEKFLNEAADLMYHYLLLVNAKGYELNEVVNVLRSRDISK